MIDRLRRLGRLVSAPGALLPRDAATLWLLLVAVAVSVLAYRDLMAAPYVEACVIAALAGGGYWVVTQLLEALHEACAPSPARPQPPAPRVPAAHEAGRLIVGLALGCVAPAAVQYERYGSLRLPAPAGGDGGRDDPAVPGFEELAWALAGPVAAEVTGAGGEPLSRQDLQRWERGARVHASHHHYWPWYQQPSDVLEARVNAVTLQRIGEHARARARAVLEANRDQLEDVIDRLLSRRDGRLERDEVEALRDGLRGCGGFLPAADTEREKG